MSVDRVVTRGVRDPFLDGLKIVDYQYDIPLTVAPGYSMLGSFCQIARGNQDNQRNGRQVRAQRLCVKFWMTADRLDTGTSYSRVVFVRDRQYTGAVTTPAMVLESLRITSFQNRYNRDRFEILYDETFNMDVTSVEPSGHYHHLMVPLTNVVLDLNMTLTYSGAAGNTIRGNDIFGFFLTEASNNSTYFHGNARLFYDDE